jgi:hypothetical protein
MHLVQLLLPLYDNAGQPFAPALYEEVRKELVARFGGLTTYSRAPAKGMWKEGDEPVRKDDIVVYEVMAETLDRPWWAGFRQALEAKFAQEEMVVRAQRIELL